MNSAIEDILQILKSSPSRAADMFARWAYAALTNHPIRELVSMDDVNRQDAIEEIIIHCVADDCRVLKLYQDSGVSFTGWFYRVARNKTIDFVRSKRFQPLGDEDIDEVERADLNPSACQEHTHENRQLVDLVWNLLGRLGEKCQLLIKLAAEEFTPQEMVVALGLPASSNRKVSDDLRYCRKKLKELLSKEGLSISDISL